MPPFIKGLNLSELFFNEAVQPILSTHFPQLELSAGRLDFGSEVLGFDTPMSRDHHWGPRVMLFLRKEDLTLSDTILDRLSHELPYEFYGYSTNFTNLESDSGVMKPVQDGPVNHYVQVSTVEKFFLDYAGVDVDTPMNAVDWLVIPWQRLATISSGVVFHDAFHRLSTIQMDLSWYPDELWLYLLAAQWRHIDQEEPFMGRCGDVGDEQGSRDVAARLMHRLMQLCFLMEKRYPTYTKWFGTAFSKLNCADELKTIFDRVHTSRHWQERERHLSEAYMVVGRMHNELNLTPFIEPRIASFHDRPYQVPHSGRFVDALREKIASADILSLPPYLGSVDQFVDNTDLLESISLCQRMRGVYRTGKID